MLCNQYDNLTGRYILSFLADIDPMNPERYLVPAFCTLEPLPERPLRTWPFWRDEKWEMLPDYRGVRLYHTSTGEPAEVLVAGVRPDDVGLTETPRPSDEYVWGDGAWVVAPAVVAEKSREAAMREFLGRMERARQQNFGKSDARVTGKLSDIEEAMFDAWAEYQVALVRVVDLPTFPNGAEWPAEPDPAAVLARVEAARAEKAAREAIEAAREAEEAARRDKLVNHDDGANGADADADAALSVDDSTRKGQFEPSAVADAK